MFIHDIKFGDGTLTLYTSGMTAVYYEQVFHEDVIKFMFVDAPKGEANDADAVKVAQKLCFIMKSQAEKKDMKSITLDSYYEWLDTISQMDLIRATWDVLGVFREEMKGLSTSKKKQEEQSAE